MKSIRSRITFSYLLLFFGIWLIAGSIGLFYVRMAISQNSDDAMNFLLQQKISVLDNAFDGISNNVKEMSRFISQINRFDEKTYAKMKQNVITGLADQKFVKTIYFCPNPETTSSSKCLYLLSLKNSNSYYKDSFIDLSFDINEDDNGSKEKIPWFYEAKERKESCWIGTYQSLNIEDVTTMLSYMSPIYSGEKFLGVAGVEISTSSLRSEIDNIDYRNAFCILANNTGDLIYHKEYPAGLPLEYFEMSDELIPLKEFFMGEYSSQNAVFSYHRKNEKHRITMGKLKNGMSLALSVPVSQLAVVQNKMIYQMVLLFVLSLLFSIFIIAMVTSKIVKPIEILNQSAHYIAHGELTTKIPVYSKDELGMLASSIRKIEVELSEYIEHIRAMAYKDFMTGCNNKGAYLKKISDIEKKIGGGMAVFNVYVFDVNGLKRINDTQGHDMGDELIKGAAGALKMTFDEKSIYRTGGDEFVVITEDENDDIDENLAAFNEAVDAFNKENEFDFTLAVSIGTATYKDAEDKEFKTVAERADKNMYQQKEEFYSQHEEMRR